MGRAMRWLKKLLTGRKEGDGSVTSDWHDAAGKDASRWSFVKQRKSGADAGKPPPSSQALSAATVKPCHCDGGSELIAREEKAAVVVQKAFRGYLARKALRALRSLVKLQALVRGYLVRKQAATTLHRLQALIRLQAQSYAVKRDTYRKSMEQERIITQDHARTKSPSAKPAHRRRLSDSTDSNYERSPRIVEVDTCHLRSRSSRIASGRYTPDRSRALLAPDLAPLFSPLSVKQPPRLSTRREPVIRHAKTAQNTPRFSGPVLPYRYDSPAKSVDGGLTPRPVWHRDLLASPRYMAGTASSAARTLCQSAPRQPAEALMRASLASQAGSRKSACARVNGGYFSEATRSAAYSGLSEEMARDYYLDRMW